MKSAMRYSLLFLIPVLATEAAVPGAGQDPLRPYALMVGDKAPALWVSEWVRGPEIAAFGQGAITVVEFWATWCGPCKESIPHLSELAERYRGKVRIAGINVWESAPEKVPEFVTKMGDRMSYSVARDLVPPFPADVQSKPRFALENGRCSQDWLAASGWEENGIPVAFIVDGDGRIAWIGEPLGGALDEPLRKVVEGSWNTSAFASEYARQAAVDKKVRAATREMNDARKAKNFDAAISKAEEIMAFDRSQAHLAGFKFEVLLADKKDRTAAYRYAESELPMNGYYQALSQMAWVIVFEDGRNAPEDLALAEKLAGRAHEMSKGTRPGICNTLARIAFLKKDFARAVDFQSKALALASDEDARQEYRKTLDEYRRLIR